MKNSNTMIRVSFLALLLAIGTMTFAQVSGVVVDVNGEPVIGASILEKGTTNGTITDFDGNFSISTQPNAVLQVSYIGFKSQEVSVAGQKVLKIVLHEDNELLEEVVVVGYGTVKKNDATGAVTAIKPDEMNKGLQTTAQDMLQGKIAGVNVVAADGTPGGAASITIRGGASLNASNSPLIVIDGLAMDNNGIQGVANPLSMINPADIESFTVLKDASATAIYGSRASNGVILITTKKGSKGSKLQISYNGNASAGSVVERMSVLTADQLRGYATALGHKADQTDMLGSSSTNWQDQIYRTAISTDHNISLMGGVKNNIVDMPYRASIGYTLQNGAIYTSQMQRVTASVNLNPSFLNDHLVFNINTKGMYIYNRFAAGVVGSGLSMDPTMPIKGQATNMKGDVLGSTTSELDRFFGGYYQRTVTPAGYGDPSWPVTKNAQTTANPVAALEHKNDRSNAGSFIGNVEADYKIHGLEDMHIHANFGADYSYGKQVTTYPVYSYDNHYYGWDGWSDMSKYNLQFSTYLQYGHDWEDVQQHFDIMAGFENQYFYRHTKGAGSGFYQSTNTTVDTDGKALAGQPYNQYASEWMTDNALQSFYGRVNWNGWNQLLVTATFRADGSSRFAKKNSLGKNARWGLFPSLAIGWKIKETFLKDVNAINDLKLRVGYGVTGQQDLGLDYYYLPTYTWTRDDSHAFYPVLDGGSSNALYAGTDANYNDVYKTSRPGVYNTDLTWEKTYTSNIGLDFAFLNNRINGNIDYYHRRTRDLLSNVNVSAGSNFRNQMTGNIGSLYNQGVEFAINAVAVDRKHFKWDLGYNLAWNENKITQLLSDDPDYFVAVGGISSGTGNSVQAHKVGEAASSFYVYETKKLTDADGNTRWYVVDRNGDGQINQADKYIYHNPVAPITMGFQTKFQFYGFDLGLTMRASLGNYVYNDVLAGNLQWVESDKVFQNQNGGYHSVLTTAFNCYYGDNMRSNQMGVVAKDGTTILSTAVDSKGQGTFSEWYASDFFVENASFLRIDNITLGYSFVKPKIQGRAYITVSNPCVFSKYKGLDPEVAGGIDNNIYPRSLTTIAGISLNF